MDKELKELQEVICCGCPYGADNMNECDIRYCDKKEAFCKVRAAYENMKASRDFYKENYEAWING